MPKNITLPSVRIDTEIKRKIDRARETFSEKNSKIKMPLSTWREIAYEFYANECLLRKANLKV